MDSGANLEIRNNVCNVSCMFSPIISFMFIIIILSEQDQMTALGWAIHLEYHHIVTLILKVNYYAKLIFFYYTMLAYYTVLL